MTPFKPKQRLMRWLAGGAIGLVLLLAVLAVVVPLAVSTDLVRDRLERDMSAWTGHVVELGSNPQIRFLPVPRITLKNVSIRSARFPDAETLAFADSVSAEFSILSALIGNPDFFDFHFVQPVFTIERRRDGTLSWTSNAGRIAEAVAVEAARAQAEREGGAGATVPPLPSNTLGEIEIKGGTVRWIDRQSGREERLTEVTGRLDWGRIDSGVEVELDGILRGAKVAARATSRRPLLVLAGETAPLTVRFAAAPLSFTFSGRASLSATPFFRGKITLDTPSVRRALEWSGATIGPGEAIGSLAVDASLSTQVGRASLDDLILEVDGNRGIGVLDVEMSKTGVPMLAGTLAFNRLDLASFLSAFTPLPKSGDDIAATIDTRFLRQLGLDLRLSAQSATLGPLPLSDLAAAVRIDAGRAVFEVGDATAFGGTVSGKIAIAESGLEGGGEVQVSAREVDFAGVFAALGLTGPLPQGPGSLNADLRSTQPLWATSARDLKGTLKLDLAGGTVPAFDLAAFRERSSSDRFFDLGGVSGGAMPFETATFEAHFANGLAELRHGEIVAEAAVIELSGILPYTKGSLAMAGTLGAPPVPDGAGSPSPDAAPVLKFFVGGSWPSPVISPIVGN